jgi:hypothetical protein
MLVANAYHRPVLLLGTITADSKEWIPSGSTILLASGTIINSTLTNAVDPHGGTGHWGPFYADDTDLGARTHATTLAAASRPGFPALVLTSGTGYTAGAEIIVDDAGQREGAYTVASVAAAWQAGYAYAAYNLVTNDTGKVYACIVAGTSAGAGGPTGTSAQIQDNTAWWTYLGTGAGIKLDRATIKTFANGSATGVSAGFPKDISIIADKGAILQGTGPRGIQIAYGQNCLVRGLHIKSSFDAAAGSFDWGGFGNTWQDMAVEYVANNGGWGLALEDNENGAFVRCNVKGFQVGIHFEGAVNSVADNCNVEGSTQAGYSANEDAGDTTEGPRNITFTACTATRCGVGSYGGFAFGIGANSPGSGIRLIGCTASYNYVGLYSYLSGIEIVGGLFEKSQQQAMFFAANTTGHVLTSVRTTGNNTQVAAGTLTATTIYLGSNAELRATDLTASEVVPVFSLQSETGVTLTLDNLRINSTYSGGNYYGINVVATGSKIRVNGYSFNSAGVGGVYPIVATAAATIWLNGLRSTGSALTGATHGAAGVVFAYGPDMSEVTTHGSGQTYNFGTVVAAGTGNAQTVPASCAAGGRPPTFTRTVTGGSVFNPPIVVMGAGSFTAQFSATDTSTYAWRL